MTGTGPHAGDDKARRFTFWSIKWATRIHSVIVWIAVLMALSLLWQLRKRAHDREVLDAPLTAWMCVAVAQGAVGYLQYANGVPPPLVARARRPRHHVVGASPCGCGTATSRPSGSARSMIAASRQRGSVAEAADEGGELVDGRGEE